MQTLDALAALRSLDALPAPRRRHLAAVVVDARTDPDRRRIVRQAQEEDRRVRENLEADLKAELASRRAQAQAIAERPSAAAQRAYRRVDRTEGTTPAHRPVTVRFVEPTKVTTAEQMRERRPLMSVNRKYDDQKTTAPATPKPEPKPRPEAQHGSLTLYQKGCRCEMCRAAKSAANRRERERRAKQRAARKLSKENDPGK